jgi:hypothetical protein
MRRLLDNRDVAVQLGQKGREHVKNNFSMAHHIGVLNALINA